MNQVYTSISSHMTFVPYCPANEYGLFKPDEDPTKGRWLEQGRTLEYYHLKSGVGPLPCSLSIQVGLGGSFPLICIYLRFYWAFTLANIPLSS